MDKFPGVLAGFGVWTLVVVLCAGCPDGGITSVGAFGDAFGPVTGFVTAMALIAAIAGNAQQAKMLHLQQEELRLTRQEMKDTRAVLAQQEAAQARQADLLEEANRLQWNANKLNGEKYFAGLLKEHALAKQKLAGTGHGRPVYRLMKANVDRLWEQIERFRKLFGSS